MDSYITEVSRKEQQFTTSFPPNVWWQEAYTSHNSCEHETSCPVKKKKKDWVASCFCGISGNIFN